MIIGSNTLLDCFTVCSFFLLNVPISFIYNLITIIPQYSKTVDIILLKFVF